MQALLWIVRENQCRDYTKRNTDTNTTEVRGHKIYTCATKKTELDIFWYGKQMNHKTCLEIFMIYFFFLYFAENLGV